MADFQSRMRNKGKQRKRRGIYDELSMRQCAVSSIKRSTTFIVHFKYTRFTVYICVTVNVRRGASMVIVYLQYPVHIKKPITRTFGFVYTLTQLTSHTFLQESF